MRIVDFDAHLSWQNGDLAINGEELVRRMDEYGVDMAVTWPLVSYAKQVKEDNKAIGAAMKKYPGRIIGFGGINPMLGAQEAMDEFNRCVEEYGVRGFKLNGARDGYFINDPKLVLPVVEKIAEKNLVLAFHSGINDPVHTHPWLVGNIARQFPGLQIVMVHMGGAGAPGLYDAAIQIARECPNIVLAASEADPKAIIRAIKELGPEKVCFASDVPFCLLDVSIAIFKTVMERFDERARALVMGGNAARILGL